MNLRLKELREDNDLTQQQIADLPPFIMANFGYFCQNLHRNCQGFLYLIYERKFLGHDIFVSKGGFH